MRRFFSMLLVFCLLMSFNMNSVMAADEENAPPVVSVNTDKIATIQAEDAHSWQKNLEGKLESSYVSFNQQQWLEYKINVLTEADYKVRVIVGTTAMKYDMTVSVDGEVAVVGMIKPTTSYSDYQPITLGVIHLTAGEHKIRFTNGLGAVHFDYITLEYNLPEGAEDDIISYVPKTGPYKNVYLPAMVEAEDYDRGAMGCVSIDGYNEGEKYRPQDPIDIYGSEKTYFYVALAENEQTTYTVNVETDAIYSLYVKKGSGDLNVYFDDKPTPFQLFTDGSSQQFKDIFVANVYLTAGVHSITFKALNPDVRIDNFSLRKSTGIYYTLEDLENELPNLVMEENKPSPSVYKNLYISVNGNDSNDGSKEYPFATIKRAKEEIAKINDDMTGDIVVNIASGSYQLTETEIFTEEHSGKNGYSVIFKGENIFDSPIIHGGKKVDNWQKHTEQIWKAPLEAEEVRNLYINGYPAVRARSKYRNIVVGNYYEAGSQTKRDGITLSKKNFLPSFEKPYDMEICFNSFWVNYRFPVKDIIYREEDVAIAIDNTEYFGNYGGSSTLIDVVSGRAFYLENAMELLDEPGEFYYNKEEKAIYYYPYEAENMGNCDAYVSDVEFLVKVTGQDSANKVENITFKNLDFRYGAWNEISTTGMITNQADAVRQVSGAKNPPVMIPAQFTVNYADNVNILDCRLSCMGSSAIAMNEAVTNSEIIGNVICDISGTSIVIGHFNHIDSVADSERCQYIDVKNNMIARVANEYLQCAALAVYYEKHINVCHNDTRDIPYSGVTIGWGWSSISPAGNINYCHNRIENPMVNLDDGGAIYTLGPLRETHIAYNYIVNNQGDHGGAIYTDSGSAFLEIHNNVIGQTAQLWAQGQYLTHDMHMYDNYSTTDNYSARENSTGSYLVNTVLVTDGNWPKEAREIMENAGLEPQYENLIKRAEIPEWKVAPIYTIPEGKFLSSHGTNYIQAEDFKEGGEGIGYHKITEIPNNNSYRSDGVVLLTHPSEEGYVIATNFPGEWISYDVEIPKDGIYNFDLKGSHAWPESEPQPAVNIYINDELVLENKYTAVSNNWNNVTAKVLGTVELTEGTHNVKIEILNNGFYIDAFRLVPIDEVAVFDELGNDIDYDEGEIVLESDLQDGGAKVETETIIMFSDMAGHWAEGAVREAAKDGIINGFPDGSFRPDEQVTLEQTILMAYRAFRINPKNSILEDAKSRNIYTSQEILTKTLTREEFAEVVMKIYSVKYGQFPYVYSNDLFVDADSITPSRLIYVMGAKGAKLMYGDDRGAFRPHDGINRAEAAAALSRL